MGKQLLYGCIIILLVAACAKRQTVKPQPQAGAKPPAEAPAQPAAPQEEPSARGGNWSAVAELRTVYFDYDSKSLTPQALTILKGNAEYIKNNPDLDVLVEGYCDERGTTEYNLALGQQRAAAVREYYGQLGIPLGRIATISYGEENPADPAHNEAAWAKNRRAETRVRNRSTGGASGGSQGQGKEQKK